MSLKFILPASLCVVLFACGGGDSSDSGNSITPTAPVPEKQSLTLSYDFSESDLGFTIDTADHDVDHELNGKILSELTSLPSPYEYRQGIMFQWRNYSDDIKGFIKKKITGLKGDSLFNVNFNVELVTFMSDACVGIGGSPGQSVKVKAALLAQEPNKLIDDSGSSTMYRIDINDGQSGGDDVVVLGHIGLPIPCDDDFFANPVWEIKPLTNDDAFTLSTNSNGEAWVYLSIDSGFEGESTFYIASVELQIEQQ